MVIGLGPEYNYPGTLEQWSKNNTKYASNFGASLICRTLLKQFNADYIDDFRDIGALKNKYDTCILAFATHITTWRDVSYYADAIEKLDMKTIAPSLGIQDYSQDVNLVRTIHPSMKRILDYISSNSAWIGVRGHYTASVLYKKGYKNVVPVGCPTLFWSLQNELEINKSDTFSNPLIVYQKEMRVLDTKFFGQVNLLGQDFLDEAVFTNNLENDYSLQKHNGKKDYLNFPNGKKVLDYISQKGIFPQSFSEWFKNIGEHDFILGSRLHGCIAALIQNIPAVLITRDSRTVEMAEFYKLPSITLEKAGFSSIESIYNKSDFSTFNQIHKIRLGNYLKFLQENQLECEADAKPPGEFIYSSDDLKTNFFISNVYLENTIKEIEMLKNDIKNSAYSRYAKLLNRFFNNNPFMKKLFLKLLR